MSKIIEWIDAFRVWWYRYLPIILLAIILPLILERSVLQPGDKNETVRAYTRTIEFDFLAWTLNAVDLKIKQAGLGVHRYLPPQKASQLVLDYLELVRQIQNNETEINRIFTDPNTTDPRVAALSVKAKLDEQIALSHQMGPLAESIIQEQIRVSLKDLGLTLGGQPIPPVLFHGTPIPHALVVSPRDKIEQQNNISISPELSLEEQVNLENQVEEGLNVSTLVVPIGGIGTYPTMVYQSTNLNWLVEVVAHEWIHNYLSLRPLGINYQTTPELRTINETTAKIAGKEIGLYLIGKYYPELLPPPPPPQAESEAPLPTPDPNQPPPFDFRAEMRTTRVTVDELLAEGKIEEAESYMETRRQVFWENGYWIRKLNQAYFAFYGAYADTPGGAAGSDPVGPAVRLLREQSTSLADFIKRISWVNSFDELQGMLE